MKLLSDATEYALRAVVWLARNSDRPRTTDEIAAATGSSPGYLARVLQILGRAGIVRGKRGVAGGFVLSRDPRELTVLEIIKTVDPLKRITECPLGLAEHAGGLCSLHAHIDQAISQLHDAFGATTIDRILNEGPDGSPLCAVSIKTTDE